MRRLSTQIERIEGRRAATAIQCEAEAVRYRGLLRARVKVGLIIRAKLEACRLNTAGASQLGLISEAEAALADIPDTPELQRADAEAEAVLFPWRDAQDGAEAFSAKIAAMAARGAGQQSPELGRASLAELFLWSVIRPERGL